MTLLNKKSLYNYLFRFFFLYSVFNEHFADNSAGGDDGIRTHDPLLAGQVLSQLSYTPKVSSGVISPPLRRSF